jgi:dTDP-4-amino-4,6-dideoxygalactose transaminase
LELIPFNIASYTGLEDKYVLQAIKQEKISGDGVYTKMCHDWFINNLGVDKVLLTTSCTHALEMSAILLNISEGDEVIMPSYTFVSTANSFVLRGAKIVFIDIRPDTMNIDETKIEQAITKKTKAIVPVHYAGVPCEMDVIMDIANKHNLFVVEDAAQGMQSFYKGKPLGTIGHLGAFSFHDTKNYTSGGEGGLLIVNHKSFIDRAEIIREKGTNRTAFFKGCVDKYSWVDIGSSYLIGELGAAYLYAQLQSVELINKDRLETWGRYYKQLSILQIDGLISLPIIPKYIEHNAHMFYIKTKSLVIREKLIIFLKLNNINSVNHYIPLHSSTAGLKYGFFSGSDNYTTRESERLIRLPMYYGIKNDQVNYISNKIIDFYAQFN